MGVAWCLTKRASIITLCMYVLWFNFNLGSNFYLLLFLGIVMYDNEFETKENKI